jgi:small subunit ribosomal protein S13
MRLYGSTLDGHRQVGIGLTALFGVGCGLSKRICTSCQINPMKKIKELTSSEVEKIKGQLTHILLEGDLRRFITSKIKTLTSINCYRGIRHRKHLPVRGQRTRTNSRTCRRVKTLNRLSFRE